SGSCALSLQPLSHLRHFIISVAEPAELLCARRSLLTLPVHAELEEVMIVTEDTYLENAEMPDAWRAVDAALSSHNI
ncbi:hypothetical protein C0991_010928, partial [Blastosporella zonata]